MKWHVELPEDTDIERTKMVDGEYIRVLASVSLTTGSFSPFSRIAVRIRRIPTGISEIDELHSEIPMDGEWHWSPDFQVHAWTSLPSKDDPAWIPCSEKMPEDTADSLLFRMTKAIPVLILLKTDIGYYAESTTRYLSDGGKYKWGKYSFPNTIPQKIVAWMPVPQAKKSGSIVQR